MGSVGSARQCAAIGNVEDASAKGKEGKLILMKFLRLTFCFFVFAFSIAAAFAGTTERPNIIFLLTDDMGYSDVGCYGGKFVLTPNIDRLAREGTRFTQFYVASPVCSPSRTGFLTGMYPSRWRITTFLQSRAGNAACEQADFLDPKAPSIARTLKEAGYATGHFGKWHLGGGRDVTNAPPFREYGFDENASTWESPEPDPNITATNWIWSAQDKVKRWDRTAYFVDKTLDFLRRHKDRPCYVNLWPDDVHTPWVPHGSPEQRHSEGDTSEAQFKAVLAEYDKQVGRLLEGLKQLGLDGKTILIFTSDNGPLPAFEGARTGGLRGSKVSLYEGGTRMPFIVRWPGHTPAGRVDKKSVMNAVDLFPTLCALTGTALPKTTKFDGEDVSRAFVGKSVTRQEPIFWEYGRNETSFAYPKGRDRSPNVAVREDKWKLLVNADGTGAELYDLSRDRNETKNLAGKNQEVMTRLKEAALKWRRSLP
jgi:arylsulfatase A-like enzyme